MPQIKPFHFRLTKVSKKHAELAEALLEYLPATGVRENFHLAIRKALQKYLSDVGYYLAGMEETTFGGFFANLPSPCSVAVLSLEPFKQKGFVEFDPLLSHLVIEKLLGGKGEDFGDLRPLTETEQGVLEFLLLKLLSQIHKLCGESSRLHFRLERMTLEPAHIKKTGGEEELLICLKIHVSLLKRAGFVKIYLPHPWVVEGFLKDFPKDRDSYEYAELKNNIAKFEDQPCRLWGSLGEASVSFADVKSLEEGDVILFDKTGLKKKKGTWSGTVELLAGKGEAGGIEAVWEGFSAGGEVKVAGKGAKHG